MGGISGYESENMFAGHVNEQKLSFPMIEIPRMISARGTYWQKITHI